MTTRVSAVEIVEVGPRDGLQNESVMVSTADKISLIQRSIDAGVRRIEVASFVNPSKVPQMADAEAVIAALPDRPDVTFIGLVLNARGAERALATRIEEVGAVCVASETFAQRNQGQTRDGSVEVAREIVAMAKAAGRSAQITIGAAFGCPFEGEIDPDVVVAMAVRAAEAGPREIALADTIGVAVPAQVTRLVTRVREAIGPIAVRVHFHNTRGTGLANVWAAVQAGAVTVDASLGGLGGCPFAPGASGNVATEDVVYMLERSGAETGLDLHQLVASSSWLSAIMGKTLPSMVGRAPSFPATSHREAPLISNDPLADNTDVYAFRSPSDSSKIILIANYIPFEHPAGGPNWYNFGENIRYEIHVDNNTATPGDDIIYRFTFTTVNEDGTTFFNIRLGKQNVKTTFRCERSINGGAAFTTIVAAGTVPPNNIGPRSIESGVGLGAANYNALMTAAIATATSGEKLFCGPIDDPFFVDLGGAFDVGGFRTAGARDGLAKMNCHTIAIEVPISTLQKTGRTTATATSILDADFIIGVYANASRPSITTLSPNGDRPTTSGAWVQVSRLGMPLTNEVIIPIGQKDRWNATAPSGDGQFVPFFRNPELALYMDDSQFGGAVPGLANLRIQSNSLGAFDFRNGKPGLFPLKNNPVLDGTALSEANFGSILLPNNSSPRAVDILPAFYTGVPNLRPYQLATGKPAGNPLAAGKPFINNFLPTLGDYLRLNMAVPVTPRNSPDFSPLGIVQAAVLGLTDPRFTASGTTLQNIPNMDGFPNGRRLEDDVTTIELQAVGGVFLAAIGLWYDDYVIGQSPVTPQLVKTISFKEGVGRNDTTFKPAFPFVQTPWRGFRGANFIGPKSDNIGLGILPGYLAVSAYPNPFKSSTRIRYKLLDDFNNVRLEVTDALGRKIATYEQGRRVAGEYNFVFSKTNLAAGSYYVRLYADTYKSPTFGIVKTN